ncbi:MAG: hypothetical protein NC930_09145, partial [Candidatus Omnitrophica bacterium]|nr:hypothetical protein [Candidatus Omnitrophota bacterium]
PMYTPAVYIGLRNPLVGLTGMTPDKILGMALYAKLNHDAIIEKLILEAQAKAKSYDVDLKTMLDRFLKNMITRISELRAAGKISEVEDVINWFFSKNFLETVPAELRFIHANGELISRIRIAATGDITEMVERMTRPEMLASMETLTPAGLEFLRQSSTSDMHRLYDQWIKKQDELATPVSWNPTDVERLQNGAVVLGASLVRDEPLEELGRALSTDVAAGIAYGINTADEKIALGLVRLFSQILVIGYKSSKPLDLVKIGEKFSNSVVIASLGVPFVSTSGEQLKASDVSGILAEPQSVRAAKLKTPELIRLVKWVLSAEYLREQLLTSKDLPLPVMTPEILNHFIHLVNQLGEERIARLKAAASA